MIAEHIDCVVGMTTSVKDTSAIAFAGAFYQALGFGESVQTAFDLGCNQIDMLGLAQLQIYGVTGNQGARAQTLAASLARELATGLERLDPTDSRLALTGTAGASAPSGFGSLLADATPATVWSDTTPIPGVTLDSTR